MYRIICNSLRNYARDFNDDINNPRYRPVYFLMLLTNPDEYARHKTENSAEYRLLSHFLWHVRDCERSAQLLHELKMLGICGRRDDLCEADFEIDFDETYCIWKILLQKAYWRD